MDDISPNVILSALITQAGGEVRIPEGLIIDHPTDQVVTSWIDPATREVVITMRTPNKVTVEPGELTMSLSSGVKEKLEEE